MRVLSSRKSYSVILSVICLVFGWGFAGPTSTWAQTETVASTTIPHSQFALFINQVRGEECCDKGSLEHLKVQLDTFQKFHQPATFAIRYDALVDARYIQLLKSRVAISSTLDHELALFLEITPSLAKMSGVEYRGSPSNWYQAQYAYTLGYSPTDRQKLIDTAMEKFKAIFGSYPKTTVGWIMDTSTINYLREKYSVAIHQITREQWGTDSYTLSGGPIHYPYFADQNWAFIPASNIADDLPTTHSTLILRQTISDPLRNYGDTTSAFTSQPNDYARDDKNLEYFKKLFDQALNQTHNSYSIGILGLENSMAREYQDEYAKQIEYVASKTALRFTTPTQLLNQLTVQPLAQSTTAVIGRDLVNNSTATAYWITTPYYRVRILQHQQAVLITDFRLYRSSSEQTTTNQPPIAQLTDPYSSYTAQNLGYWVAPFLIDGSRFYTKAETQKLPWHVQLKDAFKAKMLPEYRFPYQSLPESQNDLTTTPMSLELPPPGEDTQLYIERESESIVKLWYLASNDHGSQKIELQFHPTRIDVAGVKIANSFQFQFDPKLLPFVSEEKRTHSHLITWHNSDQSTNFHLQLAVDCEDAHHCQIQPIINPNLDWSTFRDNFYPYLFPEVVSRPINADKTTLYVHNRFAIAGRNPIRIVYVPKDEQGYPIKSDTPLNIITTPKVGEILQQPQQGQDGLTFIDVIENRVGKYQLEFQLADQTLKSHTVYFAPDCKSEKIHCLIHPNQAAWFVLSLLQTRLREW